jgi:hypothetical protein
MWKQTKIIYGRTLAVMRLDEKVIAEIHADHGANYQAVVVVYVSSLGSAVFLPGEWFTTALFVPFRFIIWWLLGAYVIYFIGTRFLATKDTPPIDFAPLARGIGFAMAPRILLVFLFVVQFGLAIGWLIQIISVVWMFAAIVTSTRISLGQPSYTRITWIVGLAMLPVILLEPFILGQQ